ncbi:amidohydrolase family protein [Paenibacillus sp. JTLBN-2024]
MLTWDGIDGVAEVMNYHGVIHEDPRMMGILEANERAGKIPQGHAPTVVGRELSAYLVAGPDSDHECRTMEEAIAKLRAGMIVDIRESSFSLNMAEVAKAIAGKGYLPNVTLCTDDVLASDLIDRGHINHVVVRAIEEGIPAVDAIRYATLNAANRLNRKDVGAIAPGRLADIVLVDALETMNVSDVFIGGEAIVKEGRADQTPAASGAAAGVFANRAPAGNPRRRFAPRRRRPERHRSARTRHRIRFCARPSYRIHRNRAAGQRRTACPGSI